MSPELYDALAADIRTLANATGMPLDPDRTAELWNLFHRVMYDRSYDDDHPGYASGHWRRILPHEDRCWLDRFYKDADLNDSHILTALRKIARTTQKEPTK